MLVWWTGHTHLGSAWGSRHRQTGKASVPSRHCGQPPTRTRGCCWGRCWWKCCCRPDSRRGGTSGAWSAADWDSPSRANVSALHRPFCDSFCCCCCCRLRRRWFSLFLLLLFFPLPERQRLGGYHLRTEVLPLLGNVSFFHLHINQYSPLLRQSKLYKKGRNTFFLAEEQEKRAPWAKHEMPDGKD